MKLFSKLFSLYLILAMAFSLSSCRIKLDRDVKLTREANITSIDVYNYTEDFEGNATDLRELSTPVYTIPKARISEFASALEDVDFVETAWFPLHIDYAHIFSNGYVVVIEYDDGGYDLIAEHGTFIHRLNENDIYHNYTPADYRGDIPWNEFVESYIHE